MIPSRDPEVSKQDQPFETELSNEELESASGTAGVSGETGHSNAVPLHLRFWKGSAT